MKLRGKAWLLCGMLVFFATVTYAVAESPTPAPATLPPPVQDALRPTPVPTALRDLEQGNSGNDVVMLKNRMQYLGYFSAGAKLSPIITKLTLERLNLLLDDNGMGPVKVVSVEIQDMILSRDDFAIVPTPSPGPTPEPMIVPVGTPALPMLDAEGFLQGAGGEFVYTDTDDGLWYYISDSLYVNIRRYNDVEAGNIWCEAEIRTRGGEGLRSYFSSKRAAPQTPVAIARDNNAVLLFNDDYFRIREYGVAVRDGVVYRDYIRKTSTSFPLGDTLAVFDDGRMLASEYSAYTAEELLAQGAVHVLTFGPWLISGGEINPRLVSGDYMHYREPRCALGMIAPGHYVVLVADGRYEGAGGVYIQWLAQRMQEIGVTEAINLDGGGTTAMVFMGMQITRVASAKPNGAYTRKVTSVLGFGMSDSVPN